MKKIIIGVCLLFACITQANCQMKGLYSRTMLSNPAYIHTRYMINPQIDTYNRFPSREDLNRLKENLEKIMFYELEGYRARETSQIKGNINNTLLGQTDSLSNLNDFIYRRFPTDIIYVRLIELNRCILDTFDRKSSIYIEAYNKLAQIGEDIRSYPLPAQVDGFGNVKAMPYYYF